MTEARPDPANGARAPGGDAAAGSTPGGLRLAAGLTLLGAFLPFSPLPLRPVYVLSTGALTLLHTWGLFRFRPHPRWLWWLIATAMWTLVVGDVVAATVGWRNGEVVMALGYLLGLVAVGALVRMRGHWERGALLDAVFITSVLGAVLWHASTAPVSSPDSDPEQMVVRIVISVLHIVGLFLVARLLTSGRVPPGLWLFTAGFGLTVLIDLATAPAGNGFLEPIWVALIIVSRGAFASLTLGPGTLDLLPRHRQDGGPTPRRRVVALTAAFGIVLVPALAVLGLETRLDLLAYLMLVPLAAAALAVRVWRVLGEHEEVREQLAHDAGHDPLTGLANRRSLLLHVREGMSAADGRGIVVLYGDLDGFKLVNDRLGHGAGDECLAIMSRRLAGVMRPGDLVGRIGGDEFVMSCRDVSTSEEADAIARRVIEVVDQPLVVEDTEITLRMSIGMRFARRGDTAEELISDADAAMYTAKQATVPLHGRRGARATRPSVATNPDALDGAVASDQLRLHLQPVCRLDSGRLSRVEALVRWQHPAHGLLSPEAFIPAAEETDVIEHLGRWSLHAACRWLADARRGALVDDVTVSVNVASRQLTGGRLLPDVLSALDATGIPPGLLCLELIESSVLSDRSAVLETTESLRRLGVRLAIDDFGVGSSSFAALSWLPVDTITLDQTFTSALHAFGRERAVARAAVQLGHELDLSVVAKGVETGRQWTLLRELGCDEAQGFLLGRPTAELRVERPGWIEPGGQAPSVEQRARRRELP